MPKGRDKGRGKKIFKKDTGAYLQCRAKNQRQRNVERKLKQQLKKLRKKHPNVKYKIVGNSIERGK